MMGWNAKSEHNHQSTAGSDERQLSDDGDERIDTLCRRHFSKGNRMIDLKLEAMRLFKPEVTASTMSEYEREQMVIRKNRERLKAERLAREAKISENL